MGNKGTSQVNSTTTSAPDPQAYAAYQQLMQRAQGVASTPYQPYTGELVAPVNAQQNLGISGVNSFATAAQPSVNAGLNQIATAGAPLTAQTIQSYMNPYTQNVVDATQAQFANQNAQQLQNVKGNAIAQGALGGNREAIAEAETANQQNLAQAPVIAGLYNQGYGQAVNTAEAEQQLGLQAGSLTGNLGIAGQTAGLQGAQSQIGAGTLQQNTQQMLDAAQLAQYYQQQAYPYQQTQWLAGIDTGVGSQMGGTSSGQTTQQTSPWNSIAGGLTSGVGLLGATGAFGSSGWLASALPMLALSDIHDKENVRAIGKTYDGQTIYRFNYKGDKAKKIHVGLIAQEVEKKKPHAVHNLDGHKYVDYDAATRARGGGVAGYDSGGGVAPMPWAGASSWIPTANIAHGSGAPHASAPSLPNSQTDPNKQAQQIGQMAKSLTQGFNSGVGYVDPGSAVPGDIGPSSVGGPNGPMPLVGAKRGGAMGVAGYADGGTPDDSPASFDDRFNAAFPNYTPPPANDQNVVNPDEPYRMPDQPSVDDWRKGVNRDLDLGQTAQNKGVSAKVPEDVASADMPVSQGVAPSRMAFSGDTNAPSDLPDEVALGYSGGHGRATGVAPPSDNSSGGVDWGANGKLWPALMAAGFGMMSSRSTSPFVAIGEGGQAGLATYGAEQQREAEGQKLAQEMELARRREEREEAAQRASAGNQPLIIGPDGKAHINKDYISAKQQLERDWQPKMQKIGVNMRGDDVMGVYDPNTKRATDLNGNPVNIINGVVQPIGAAPVSSPAIPPTGNPEPQASSQPSSPANASAAAQNPYKVASLGIVPPSHQQPSNAVPYDQSKPVAPATMDNPNTPTPPPPPPQQAPPHPADPNAPEGTDASRDTQFLADVAKQDPGYALAIKKAANYELDPGKYASMMKGHRERFINDVLRYDGYYKPQDIGLRYKAEAAFLPGTKTGDTVRSFNTAVAHLDTLREAYKAVENGNWQTFNALKNRFQAEFGYAPPNTLNAIAQIVGGEVVKATVGAQNALGDREELRKSLEPKLAEGQALAVIDHFQQLMGGQLHSLKFAYEQGTGLHNFDEKYLLPRSREVLKHVDAEAAGTAPKELSPQDQQAADWAKANPNDPRAAAIKKKLGIP